MKVLMFSTDKNIFVEGSEVQHRMLEYGSLVEELHIIVKSHGSKATDQKLNNVFIYPTNSFWPIFYIWDAYKIGKSVVENYKLKTCPSGRRVENSVITAQDPFETGLAAYLLKRKFGLSLQVQIHTDFLSSYFYKESVKNKIRVFLARLVLRRADSIRAVSERIKKSIILELGISAKKVSVLAIFVDIESIGNAVVAIDLHKKYPGRFIILMASRLTKEKNISLAIKAVNSLIPNQPNLLLLIVGSGPEEFKLKLLTTHYKLQANVVFEPWNNDLASYYKTADLFLLTSNYEGYGRTVVEAMAAGLPVVMTDVGIGVGLVARVGNESNLAEKIANIISNPEKRKQVLREQDKFLKNWPTKSEYLLKIKESWSHE